MWFKLRTVFPYLVTAIVWMHLCNQPLMAGQAVDQLVKLALQVSQTAKQMGITSVTIQVIGSTTYPGSGPAMVREVLGTEFQKEGLLVKKLRADAGVKTEMKVLDQTEVVTLRFDVVLLNSQDTELAKFKEVRVTDQREVAQILGAPAQFTGAGGSATTANVVSKALKNPTQNVDGQTVVRATSGSPFGVEILTNGQPHAAELEDGLAMVPLRETDEFSVRLVNDSDFEVGIELALDGIDSLWFTKNKGGYWLVRPKSKYVVAGWQQDESAARKFRVAPFEKSVAAQVGSTEKIGVITATFARAYSSNETIPDEDNPRVGGGKGVGLGDSIENKVKFVDRKFGKVRATVPIRYEKP